MANIALAKNSVKEAIAWAKGDTAAKTLFDRLAVKRGESEGTVEVYSVALRLWSEFSKMTPRETVAKWKAEAKADYEEALNDWDMLLDRFVTWQIKEKGKGRNVAIRSHAVVKSLVKYNCKLKLAVGTPKHDPQTSIAATTLDEFKEVFATAGPAVRWQIAGLKDSGMSRGDFVELTYKDVKAQLEKGEKFIHMNVVRRKEKVKYETFLGPNAVDALKAYLKVREVRGEKITDATWLTIIDKRPWTQSCPNALTKNLMKVGARVGVDLSPHRLRKMFETYLSADVKSPIVLKYWMGHQIAGDIESHYIIPNEAEQRRIYEGAYKAIDVSGGSLESRVRAVEDIMATLTPEQKAEMEKRGVQLRAMKRRESLTPQKEDREKCGDGRHCGEEYAQIDETELLGRLKAGWRVEHELSGGQVIVSR